MFFGKNGFDSTTDNSFFSTYFGSSRGSTPSYTSGTYSSYASSGTPGSTYFRYAEPSSTTGKTYTYSSSSGSSGLGGRTTYTTSSSNPGTYRTYTRYTTSNGGVFSGQGVSAFGNDSTTNTSSTKNAEEEELPAEGEKIRKIQHVTRQYPYFLSYLVMAQKRPSSEPQ